MKNWDQHFSPSFLYLEEDLETLIRCSRDSVILHLWLGHLDVYVKSPNVFLKGFSQCFYFHPLITGLIVWSLLKFIQYLIWLLHALMQVFPFRPLSWHFPRIHQVHFRSMSQFFLSHLLSMYDLTSVSLLLFSSWMFLMTKLLLFYFGLEQFAPIC